jgi:hypothetical protein
MVYITGMILTPNITIDNENMDAFNDECLQYTHQEGEEIKYHGSGDFAGSMINIKKIRTPQGNGLLVIVSNRQEAYLVCRLIAAPIPQGVFPWGRKVYVMDRIRIHSEYAGRGLAPMLYGWLSENGYTIMSDSHQNGNSLAVWHKLGKKGGVFTVNIEDGMWRPYDPTKVEDWMVFGNNDPIRYWPIRFVLPAK